MKLIEWNKCIAYARQSIIGLPDVKIKPYTMHGENGIEFMIFDSFGSYFKSYYSGICESFDAFCFSVDRQIAKIKEEME